MNPDVINYALGIVGTILGIVGIFLTIRSIKKKEPVYYIRSTNLISAFSPQYKDLKVSYKRRNVENLTASNIVFFNRGAEMIDRDDIRTVNPLRIIPKDETKILDVSVLLENNPSSQFRVHLDQEENQVLLDFDYLSKDQGVRLQVIHTGLSSEDLDIVGDIKDVATIRRISLDRRTDPRTRRLLQTRQGKAAFLLVGFVCPLSALLLLVLASLSPDISRTLQSSMENSPYGRLISNTLAIVGTVLMLSSIYRMGILTEFRSAPPGLEFSDYEQETTSQRDK